MISVWPVFNPERNHYVSVPANLSEWKILPIPVGTIRNRLPCLRINGGNFHEGPITFAITFSFHVWIWAFKITKGSGKHFTLPSQIVGALLLEMSMTIAFVAHDSLRGLRILPIILELHPITFGGWKFSFVEWLPTVFHLQKFAEFLCKECYLLLHIIFFRGVIHSLVDGFESKWFARLVERQSKLICLERSNEFLDLDLIQIFALFCSCGLCTKALW